MMESLSWFTTRGPTKSLPTGVFLAGMLFFVVYRDFQNAVGGAEGIAIALKLEKLNFAVTGNETVALSSIADAVLESQSTLRVWEWKNEPNATPTQQFAFFQETKMQPFQNLIFFGDSTIRHLHQAIVPEWKKLLFQPEEITKQYKYSSRCNRVKQYFDLEPAFMWVPPNRSRGEGPVSFGLRNAFCSDCSGCPSSKWSIGTGKAKQELEFIQVEFARDVEHASLTTATTQETVALYLELEAMVLYVENQPDPVPRRLCVVNTGFHDMAVQKDPDIFVENLKEYLESLAPHCGQMVWIAMSNPKGLPGFPQKRKRVQQWNEKVKEMLSSSTLLLEKVIYLDIWEASKKAKFKSHLDNLHFEGTTWYDPLAQLFVAPLRESLASPESPNAIGHLAG